MLKHAFFTVLLFLFSLHIYSQTISENGYLVKSSKDTISGYLQGENNNGFIREVKFKQEESSVFGVLSPSDYIAFSLGKYQMYEAHSVKISTGEVEPTRLSKGIDTGFRQGRVFLKVVERGRNVSLFRYDDGIKTRFYIRKNGFETLEELMLYRYYSPSNVATIVEREYYKTQLSLLFDEFGVAEKQKKELLRNGYNEKDMLDVVAIINNDKVFEENKKGYLDFFAGAGVTLMPAKFVGDPFFASGSYNVSSPAPYFQVGIDAYANPISRRLKLRVNLGYMFGNTEFSKEEPDYLNQNVVTAIYGIKQRAFLGEMNVSYVFYQTSMLRFSGGWGMSFSYLGKGNETYMKSLSSSFSIPAYLESSFFYPFYLSVILKDKFEFVGKYSPPSNLTANYLYGLKVSRIQFGFNYIFTRYKRAK